MLMFPHWQQTDVLAGTVVAPLPHVSIADTRMLPKMVKYSHPILAIAGATVLETGLFELGRTTKYFYILLYLRNFLPKGA